MPRTVESIVACYQEAYARRQAGRRIWDATLPLRPVLKAFEAHGDNLTAEQAVQMAQQLGAVLVAGIPAPWRNVHSTKYSMDLEDVIDFLTQATAADFVDDEDTPCDTINHQMDQVYDWADRSRVWIS